MSARAPKPGSPAHSAEHPPLSFACLDRERSSSQAPPSFDMRLVAVSVSPFAVIVLDCADFGLSRRHVPRSDADRASKSRETPSSSKYVRANFPTVSWLPMIATPSGNRGSPICAHIIRNAPPSCQANDARPCGVLLGTIGCDRPSAICRSRKRAAAELDWKCAPWRRSDRSWLQNRTGANAVGCRWTGEIDPIVGDSCRSRAKFESRNFSFEIKSEKI
jgi:hypothetical protein